MTNLPDDIELPSERKFGLLFVIVFLALAGYGYLSEWMTQTVFILLAAGLILAIITALVPHVLAPFNRAWLQLGLLLGKIVNPIVLGIIFFGVITPVAIVTKLFGRDELRLKPKNLSSYWIDRQPPCPASDSYKNQY